jgi:hypothetical protein
MKRGSNGFTDAAVVVLAILLFFRTADVLTYFAPPLLNNMVGMDVSWLYAVVMAFFVEGVALAFHFDARAHKHTPAIIVKWTLLAISGLCQVFDGNIVSGTIAEMSGPMKVGFQWGVPLLPIFVVVLLFYVGKLPDEDEARRSWLDRLQDKGIKSRLPDPRAIWEGRKENTEFSPADVVDANLAQAAPPAPNGQNSGVANPTSRQP